MNANYSAARMLGSKIALCPATVARVALLIVFRWREIATDQAVSIGAGFTFKPTVEQQHLEAQLAPVVVKGVSVVGAT